MRSSMSRPPVRASTRPAAFAAGAAGDAGEGEARDQQVRADLAAGDVAQLVRERLGEKPSRPALLTLYAVSPGRRGDALLRARADDGAGRAAGRPSPAVKVCTPLMTPQRLTVQQRPPALEWSHGAAGRRRCRRCSSARRRGRRLHRGLVAQPLDVGELETRRWPRQ